MLLMSAFQIGDPVAAFIQMKINDLSRSALRLRVQDATYTYSTLFLCRVPDCIQKPGLRDHVPLMTDSWGQKEEDRVVLSNEVANAKFVVGRTA